MPTRRDMLFGGVVAPAMLHSAAASRAYKWAEIEKMIETGRLQGRLTRADLPTPALLLDLDAFESNVAKMTRHAKRKGLALRPHGKTHKCPEIAKRLVKAGAAGTCAAKISEAEAFAANGVDNLLVTTAVIGKYKIERGVRLAANSHGTILCVDDPQNVHDLNDAAGEAGIRLDLAVDLMVGNRTGVPTGEQAVKLAQLIDKLPNVRLKGMQSYVGFAAHVNGFEARKKRSIEAMAPALETRRLVEKSGVECGWLSGASTGTYNIDCDLDGVTELQPGSFIFMDIDYNRIGGKDGPEYHDFQNSLTVLTTVVSAPEKNRVVVDGGLKAFATDRKFGPDAKDAEGLDYSWGGDEHGQLDLTNAAKEIRLGDKVEFIVPHCDPTVNLYDQIFCLRGENVEAVWQIAARGRSQ